MNSPLICPKIFKFENECSHSCLTIRVTSQSLFTRKMPAHLPDGGSLFSQTHSPVLPLRRKKRSQHQLSNGQKGEENSTPHHLHLPSLCSRYAFMPLTSPFCLTIPLWLAGFFILLFNKRNKGGRATFPLFPSAETSRRGAEDHPIENCRSPALHKSLHETAPVWTSTRRLVQNSVSYF